MSGNKPQTEGMDSSTLSKEAKTPNLDRDNNAQSAGDVSAFTSSIDDIDEESIGPRIRAIRKEQNMTISHLSKLAGCTNATISKIERNQMTPSISILKSIINALGLTLAGFLSDPGISNLVVMRPDQRIKIRFPQRGIHSQLLVTDLNRRRMQPLFEIIEPGSGSEGEYNHKGEEFVFVLEGILTIRVGGKVYELGPDDSMYYESNKPHSFANKGVKPVKVIWVISPPTY